MPKSNPENLLKLLAGLPLDDITITESKKQRSTYELFVTWKEPKGADRICPHCGCDHCVKKDGGTMQTVRHSASAVGALLVTFHKPRFVCRTCGKSFFVKPSWVMEDMSITTPLCLQIYECLTSTSHSITEIARDTRTSPAIVRNVMEHITFAPPASLPETLGIDEFHGDSGYWDPEQKRFTTERLHCVIIDADTPAIIDIRYKATEPSLREYFMQYPLGARQQVRFYCTDMRPGFLTLARNCFPKAKICIDPFHVVRLLTKAISEIRLDEWHYLLRQAASCKDQEKKKKLEVDAALLKKSQRILVTSKYHPNRYWNRKASERDDRLWEIFALAPDLEIAYNALQEFYDVENEIHFNFQRTYLGDWIRKFSRCDVPPIRKAVATIQKYRKEIENAWHYNKSNSSTEGFNKRIKDIKRLSFGAHSFENFRKRVLLACGYVHFVNEPFTIFAEKKSASSDGDTK